MHDCIKTVSDSVLTTTGMPYCTWHYTRVRNGKFAMAPYTTLTGAHKYDTVLYYKSRDIRDNREGICKIQDWTVKGLKLSYRRGIP